MGAARAYFDPVFLPRARVAKQKTSHGLIQPMIHLETIITFFRTFKIRPINASEKLYTILFTIYKKARKLFTKTLSA